MSSLPRRQSWIWVRKCWKKSKEYGMHGQTWNVQASNSPSNRSELSGISPSYRPNINLVSLFPFGVKYNIYCYRRCTHTVFISATPALAWTVFSWVASVPRSILTVNAWRSCGRITHRWWEISEHQPDKYQQRYKSRRWHPKHAHSIGNTITPSGY